MSENPNIFKSTILRWRPLWREHGLPFLLFGALTLAITWPAVRDFNTLIVSDGGDARNNLWMLWHVKEALLGRQPWFELDLLYYPIGVNLLTRGLGPLVGILALPFLALGPEAAYNGALILTIWLTGYAMYLLARTLNFTRPVAFFAGLFLLTAPIHLVGTNGHMTKTFMAMLPLVLLAFLRLLDIERSRWWALITAVLLLLTLLHNGYHFIFAIMAIAFFGLAAFLRANNSDRRPLLQRGLLLTLLTALFVGPLLFAILRASANPLIPVDSNLQSIAFQPDLTEFFLPPSFSALFGYRVSDILYTHGHKPTIETAVSLSWVGIVLAVIAALRLKKESLLWWLFALLTAVLAIGPSLKLLGDRTFTEYDFPLVMPYAWFTALPGLDFMRTPGRFMMISFVALSIAAAYGLSWLISRYPRLSRQLIILVSLLLLVERWPRSWSQQPLRQVPDFYKEIAADPEQYGVFDLPIKPTEDGSHITYAATYQIDQLVHQKGIASGYLARTYRTHPMFPCIIPELKEPQPDIQVNGETADCTANFLFDLAYFNYRYLVLHKPPPGDRYDSPDSWGQRQSAELIQRFFSDQPPLVDDELVTVYRVPDINQHSPLEPVIGLGANWYSIEDDWRWARSPAVIVLSLPESQEVILELETAFLFEPKAKRGEWQKGRLHLTANNGYSTTVDILVGETTAIPLNLEAGVYSISLDLEAGNFDPRDYGSQDIRPLSFAIHTINLVTQ